MSLVYAASSKLSPKIRSFIDFAATWVEQLAQRSELHHELPPTILARPVVAATSPESSRPGE